ncbi:efflux RND transporter periplasmic adaptor subunit [Waterburya agarophytonicola]|uniref:efflux RND transporter periplasmic adaptor subunit n=1 Tax=Waterburya agarophytonicola TaxID=2886916 RepID=UPI003F6F48A9
MEEQNPQPIPIKKDSLSKSLVSNSIISKSDLDLAKVPKPKAKPSLFSGKKGILMGVGLGVVLTLGVTRLFLTPTANNKGESESALVNESIAPAQTVTIAEVKTRDINSTLDASGTVTAFERTPVMSQAVGLQITEILAETGDRVDRGQVLAKLNNKTLTAQKTEAQAAVAQQKAALDELQAGSRIEEVAQAEARVANAESAIVQAESDLELIQKRVDRNRTLEQEGAITRDRFDEVLNQEKVAKSDLAGAKANLNEAKQALAQLKAGSRRQTIAQAEAGLIQAQGRLQAIEAQLGDTIIVAPSGGIIASREARVGQITSSSEMLFSIIQNGRLELRLQVPETLVGQIQSGQKVAITSNANSDLKLTGKVREIDPIVNDSSRQALVKVDLPSNTNLKPGMFLRAAINTDSNQGLAVPIEALLPQSGNKAIVFVLQPDNTVKAQTVSMGEIIDDRTIEIINGLESGDRIVLKGAAYLKDGDGVEVSNK